MNYIALQRLLFAFDQLLRLSHHHSELDEFTNKFHEFTNLARIVPTWLAYPAAEFDPRLLEWVKLGLDKPLKTKFASEVLFEQCNHLMKAVWIAIDSEDYAKREAESGFAEHGICELFPNIGLDRMLDVQNTVFTWRKSRPSLDTSELRFGIEAERRFRSLDSEARTEKSEKLDFNTRLPKRPKGKWLGPAMAHLKSNPTLKDVQIAAMPDVNIHPSQLSRNKEWKAIRASVAKMNAAALPRGTKFDGIVEASVDD